MNLLHIDSSILGEKSASRALSHEIVSRWQAAVPELGVSYLALARNPISHFGTATPAERNPTSLEQGASHDARVLEEFLVLRFHRRVAREGSMRRSRRFRRRVQRPLDAAGRLR